jgi:hypothetical protein
MLHASVPIRSRHTELYQVTTTKNPRITLLEYPARRVSGTVRDESFASSARPISKIRKVKNNIPI